MNVRRTGVGCCLGILADKSRITVQVLRGTAQRPISPLNKSGQANNLFRYCLLDASNRALNASGHPVFLAPKRFSVLFQLSVLRYRWLRRSNPGGQSLLAATGVRSVSEVSPICQMKQVHFNWPLCISQGRQKGGHQA